MTENSLSQLSISDLRGILLLQLITYIIRIAEIATYKKGRALVAKRKQGIP